jgi:hypothetical protein
MAIAIILLLHFFFQQHTVQMRALQLAMEQQHAVPRNKIAKFLVAGENLTVSVPLFQPQPIRPQPHLSAHDA